MGKLGVKSEALSGSIPPFQNEARDLVDGNRLTQQPICWVRRLPQLSIVLITWATEGDPSHQKQLGMLI